MPLKAAASANFSAKQDDKALLKKARVIISLCAFIILRERQT